MNIKIINTDMLHMTGIYEKYPEFVSKERLERIYRIKPEKDRILSFFSEIEIRREISVNTSINYSEIKFDYNEHGKPYVKNIPYHFSVSHSGNRIAFVICKKPVGIDIEKHKAPRLRVAKRFFTENEYNYIINSENPEKAFYRIWTSKESYLKMIGTGLSKSLKSFDVMSENLKSYFFTRLIEDYTLTLCCENVPQSVDISFIDSENLLESVKKQCL